MKKYLFSVVLLISTWVGSSAVAQCENCDLLNQSGGWYSDLGVPLVNDKGVPIDHSAPVLSGGDTNKTRRRRLDHSAPALDGGDSIKTRRRRR